LKNVFSSITILLLSVQFFGVGAAESQVAYPSQIANTKWHLASYQPSDGAKEAYNPPAAHIYSLQFQDNGQALLSLDCNSGSGMWSSKDGERGVGVLTMSSVNVTKNSCGADAIDGQIASDFQDSRNYTFGGNFLSIFTGHGTYVWLRDH